MLRLRQIGGLAVWIVVILAVTSQAKKKLEARKHWWDLAQNELAAALNVRDNWNVAKNVILFLGDGMGITVNTASRIYKGQKQNKNGEEGYLSWERFPNAALLKTYTVDRQVADSAASATAYLSGFKANFYTVGVDSAVTMGDCAKSRDPKYHAHSILQWAQEAGKDTGFVTTTRVTHATPAATYAHSAHRNWECDGKLGQAGTGCKGIADQLVHENPGKNIKVIMGGGRQCLGASLGPHVNHTCARLDGRNLVKEWLKTKTDAGSKARYVHTTGDMNAVDVDETDYLMGLFSDTHTPYEVERQRGPAGTPSLKQMTLKALKILKKNKNGFFLLVEGGRIDHAMHNAHPKRAMEEVLAMDDAVTATLKEIDLEETLVIATADHSHVMTINGYPHRGNDILGIGDISNVDNMPYTTLMFTNGAGYKYTTDGQTVHRPDPSTVDTRHVDYRPQAAIPMVPRSETHGGEDVGIWAAGPMSHLFHRTHEQHYVAHVMAYAACVGPSSGDKCERPAHSRITKGPVPYKPSVMSSYASKNAFTIANDSATSSTEGAGAFEEPNFPTLSPVLQHLLVENEEKIMNALGTEDVGSYSSLSTNAYVRTISKRSIMLPHD